MKKNYTSLVILFLMLLLSSGSFSQVNDCGNNAGFETGTPAGWICKSGWYGVGCPTLTGLCPAYGTTLPTIGALNPGGINAAVTSTNDRHTIVTGTGFDPNSLGLVPVVAPGGGTYSFRLGNANVGALNGGSLAEGVRLTFGVTPQNAGFTYRYAVFLQDPGHSVESQPRFEILVLDDKDSLIPCGYYKVVAGTAAGCSGTATFTSNGNWRFTNWTDVGLDLTGYIGRNVSIEFRTSDCFPAGGSSSLSCTNNICTTCINGNCCSPTPCTPASTGCSNAPGSHSAYAYIDAYCKPLSITVPEFCAGVSSIQLCAPPGYASYSWPAGQPGITGSPSTQCVTVNNPVSGTTYVINMVSVTGCPTGTNVIIKNIPLTKTRDTVLCSSYTGTIPLTISVINQIDPPYTFLWSNGLGTATSVVVNPTATTTYYVTVTNKSGCAATDSIKVTISPCSFPPQTSFTVSDTAFCNEGGRCVDFYDQSNGGPTTWKWSFPGAQPDTSTAQNPTSICYYIPGTYDVQLITSNSNGSDTLLMKNKIVFANGAVAPIVTFTNDTLFSTPAASYQWYLNGSPIAGATKSFYLPTQNGSYNVYIIDAYGCGRLGNGYVVTTLNVGINNMSGGSLFSVYPNPAGNQLWVVGEGLRIKDATIELYNVLGENVYRSHLEGLNDKLQTTIDISTLAKGVYIVQLTLQDKIFRTKVVKE